MYKSYITIIMMFLTPTLFTQASTSHSKNSELITIVKQQQRLAKNVSTLYIAFHANQKEIDKKEKMKKSIQDFNANHLKLIKNRSNTKAINEKLTEIGRIWKIAHNLSETKKHDHMLLTTINDVSQKIDELQKLYEKTIN